MYAKFCASFNVLALYPRSPALTSFFFIYIQLGNYHTEQIMRKQMLRKMILEVYYLPVVYMYIYMYIYIALHLISFANL